MDKFSVLTKLENNEAELFDWIAEKSILRDNFDETEKKVDSFPLLDSSLEEKQAIIKQRYLGKVLPFNITSYFKTNIESLNICPNERFSSYRKKNDNVVDYFWCKQRLDKHKVEIQKSWGTMKEDEQLLWEQGNCDTLLVLGYSY